MCIQARFWILPVLLVFMAAPIAPVAAFASESAFQLCYFSLNSSEEFKTMDEMARKLGVVSPRMIQVREFHDPERNPEPQSSFETMVREMIASGQKCDGLVISGHHTGSFGGIRTRRTGKLTLEFMEKLSCDPKYNGWFKEIKALWLEGCRTAGPGQIEEADDPEFSADFHMQRVGAVREQDHLTQSFSDLNREYSATLDQDNPLSSRYLRIFPAATVFGWTKSGPGRNARSELSLPYHIAQIATLNDERNRVFDNPVADELSPESAAAFSGALATLFRAFRPNQKCEDLAVQGWLEHGRGDRGYVLKNPDLNGFKSLLGSGNARLVEARLNDCIFKNDPDPKRVLEALDRILRDPVSIGYSFNTMFESMLDLKKAGSKRDLKLLDRIQKKLQSSPEVQQFLDRKLFSKQLGLIRKIDYYAFHRVMTGRAELAIEQQIRKAALEQLVGGVVTGNHHDVVNYKETLLESLEKHDLLDTTFVRALASAPLADATVLEHVLTYAQGQKNSELYHEFINGILTPRPPRAAGTVTGMRAGASVALGADDGLLARVLEEMPPLGSRGVTRADRDNWIVAALGSFGYGPRTFAAIAKLRDSEVGDQEGLRKAASDKLVSLIKGHKKRAVLGDMSAALVAIIESRPVLPKSKEILDWYFGRDDLTGWELASLAEAMAVPDIGIGDRGERLRKILSLSNANAIVQASVCRTILAAPEIAGAAQLIETVADSPSAHLDTLYSALQATFALPDSPERKGELLRKIIFRGKDLTREKGARPGASLRSALRNGLQKSREKIPGSDALLRSVMTW